MIEHNMAQNEASNQAARSYKFDLSTLVISVPQFLAKLGGKNPKGIQLAVNNQFFTQNNTPILPIMGEFHFSRFPSAYWEEEILKMKAGGIQIIATYVFWIHHEEGEGRWDWSNERNLKAFVGICAKHGLLVYLRIGPFCHGECRNGGLPDWIIKRGKYRTTDPGFLVSTKKLYEQIAQQVRGYLWKDGGPIIMIQLDNEYDYGKDQGAYILELQQIANDVGLQTPFINVTGWVNAVVPGEGSIIPMYGGYPEAPWEGHTKPLVESATKNYIFSHFRWDGEMEYNNFLEPLQTSTISNFPYCTVELGAGNQITYHRRPIIQAMDVIAMAIVKLGNGCNLLGYYMFHGGTNPHGKLTTMEENLGQISSLIYPTYSYDFQSPIGEFGLLRPSYFKYRCIHQFVTDFGVMLAPMISIFPDVKPTSLADMHQLRIAIRSDGKAGFVFINNYNRYFAAEDFANVTIECKLKGGIKPLVFSNVSIPAGTVGIWSFNLTLDGLELISSTAQLFGKVTIGDAPNQKIAYVFFGIDKVKIQVKLNPASVKVIIGNSTAAQKTIVKTPEEIILTDVPCGLAHRFRVKNSGGKDIELIFLTQAEAEQTSKLTIWGREFLLISPLESMADKYKITFTYRNVNGAFLQIYPDPTPFKLQLQCSMPNAQKTVDSGVLLWQVPLKTFSEVPITLKELKSKDDCLGFRLQFDQNLWKEANDLFLSIDYVGDHAQLYLDDIMEADDFYHCEPWVVGLKRWREFLGKKALILKIFPLTDPDEIYFDKSVPNPPKNAMPPQLHQIRTFMEHRFTIQKID